ncbi:MAG: hypothetical protein ABIQ54_01250 [Gammaproteobacteria bacterium]
MKKLVAVIVLAAVSTGVWANEFIKGFQRPDGTYVAGRTQAGEDQVPPASSTRDDERDEESLVAKPQDLTLGGSLGNTGRRDPRVLRNAAAIEQIVEQENGADGLTQGDSFYVRKSVAREYYERRIPNSLRTNESTHPYGYNANSYVINNQKLNKYRKLFESNGR